ncbi:MAG: hypothetical protein IT463_13410 [Planctomycetes bacterium]|nr:hypothetical protein [Planctomycetota bacterium]
MTGGDADVVPASYGEGGCFLACVDLNQFHSAKRKAWERVLSAPCPWAFRTEASAFQALCAPVHRMGGKVVDLGDVVSNDALIDFSFETPAPAPKDSSRARVEFVRYGEGTRDELSNSAYCYEDRGTSLLLRPGRWTYRATASNDGDKKVFYDSVQGGPILAPARTVTPVHVSFKPAALIPVRFEMPDGTPCTDPISLSWRTNKDDLWDEICEGVNPQGAMVDAPRVKDGPSFYCGSSKNWADVRIEVGPGATEAVIRFSEPKPEDELAAEKLEENLPEDAVVLVIDAPHLPPELEDDCKRPGYDAGLEYRLQQENDEEKREDFSLTPGRPLRVQLYDLLTEGFKDDAELLITLVGGAARGYARGIVSGPVRVTLKPGEVVKVAMPPIPSPPWAYRASGCQGALVCGGVVSEHMSQFVRTADGKEYCRSGTDSSWLLGSLADNRYEGALLTGAPGEEYPLRLLPPEHENACAYFAAEVPVRIRVKVPTGHPWLRASVSWPCGEGSSATWCSHSATPVDGVINLWCPAGRRVVRIAHDGGPGEADKSFEVEVSESGVLEIQAETASSMVCFTGGCYENGTTSGWKVFHMSPTGCEEYECRVLPELTRSHHRYLLPGDYIARPEDVRVDANVHFEVVTGKVTHVQLPSLGPAPVGGTVVLLFDVKDLISWNVSVDCKVASSNPALNLTPDWAMNSKIETFCTLSANGVEVSGVPLGVPVVFRCFANSPDDKQRLASKPFLWCVEGDQRTHEVQWLAACPERSEWDAMTDGYDTTDEWFWQRDVSSLPGFAIGFVQAPGTYEVALYDSNEREFARVTVTITADGRGPIPEDARNILLQRGMLRPTATQPAEKAPEGGEAPQPGNGE